MNKCPCRYLESSDLSFSDCCLPFIEGKIVVQTAEQLMRARYSSYAVGNIDFIDTTQVDVEGEKFDKDEAKKWAESSEWKGLEILKTVKGSTQDQRGVVEFKAHYKDKASEQELKHHETAEFEKMNGKWMFKAGSIHGADPLKRQSPKIGRNDPCSCGSGKKFKKCCGL
jgi:SEC-C motif domain protein